MPADEREFAKGRGEEFAANAWIWGALDPDLLIRREFFESRGWVAVPMVGDHFLPEGQRRIVLAAQRRGLTQLRGVPLEPTHEGRDHLMVPMTDQDLATFDFEYGSWETALIPEDRSFVIVSTILDYSAVAGPQDLVEDVLGTSVAEARVEFAKLAFEESSGEGGGRKEDGKWLLHVSRHYAGL